MLIVGPLVGAVVVGLVGALGRRFSHVPHGRRWMPVAATVAALALWLLLTLAAQDEWAVYGRSLLLNDMGRTLFQGLLLLLAVTFALTAVWPQESPFVPLSLAVISPLAAMVMIRPYALGALFLALAVVVLVMTMQADRRADTGVAWRYLVMGVLALPFFLLAGWLADTPAAFPWGAARVLAVAAILVLGGFPFMMWVRPAARQVSVLLRPFLFGGVQLAVIAFLFGWLLAKPGWQADPGFQNWLRWSGLLTVLLGGLLAAAARELPDVLPSLLLLDVGMGLLTLLLPGVAGWETAVSILTARSISLLLAGLGWLLSGGYSEGMAQRPWAAALWFYGCFSLLGLPLTPGFAGRWALLSALPGQSEGAGGVILIALLLLGVAGGLWGVGRILLRLREPIAEPEDFAVLHRE